MPVVRAKESPALDPWLTVAEIAAELRVHPATVRLWTSKGELPARRPGLRKLLIRRSDLDALLASRRRADDADSLPTSGRDSTRRNLFDERPPPLSSRQLSTADIHGRPVTPDELAEIIEEITLADDDFANAQSASENAPPDPGFPHRVRQLACACDRQAAALLTAAQAQGVRWSPTDPSHDATLSHELRAGANRPGPADLWVRFDRDVERLAIAMRGTLMYNVAWRYRDLAQVMHEIADALNEDHGETSASA
jgi:excisionase family DNA binding protein